MSRQIVITLPEWTEIKGIDNKQFAELLPAYDEMLNMIKNGIPLNAVLDKIRAEIEKVFCISVITNELRTPMEVKTEILQITDKYRGSEVQDADSN